MNLVAYAIYILITYMVTVHVGLVFYRNGKHYILSMLNGNHSLTDSVNRILLTGYYLVNLGYAALMISTWQPIHNVYELLTSLSFVTGKIFLTLAIMHYMNMAVIMLWHRRKKYSIDN